MLGGLWEFGLWKMGLVGLWVEEGARPIWSKWLVVRPELDCGGFKVLELQLGLTLTKELVSYSVIES